ncbi:hypothetical protein ACFQV2_39020 [Actinokineospora soli]|uniref:Uncharacterized protein n=1 Tax=Actinokineospora soli TaxID=1048753 RepID=A0ABW2TYL3_9PSEU
MTSRLARGALLGACTGALAVAAHGVAGAGSPTSRRRRPSSHWWRGRVRRWRSAVRG